MRLLVPAILLTAGCGGSKSTPKETTPPPIADKVVDEVKPQDGPPAPTKPVTNKSLVAIGLDPDAMDRTADPCEDFYQFACGGWMKTKQIDADKPLAQRAFVDIAERNLAYERDLLEGLRAKPSKDPVDQKLAAYYGACMDEAAIEKAGTKPIQPFLAAIAKVKDAKSLSAAVAQLHAAGIPTLFAAAPTPDSADATKVILGMDQGGLGLPDRDYYLGEDPQSKGLKAAYEGYLAAMLVEVGHKPDAAKAEAAQVVALETELAKASKDKVARRDLKSMYNRLEKTGVAKKAPTFDWAGYWKTLGITSDAVTVGAPDFLAGMDAQIKAQKPEVWRNYLTTQLLSRVANLLTKKLDTTQFQFYAALTGQAEQAARWKRCAGQTESALGDLMGQVFVRDRFPGQSKTAAEEAVHAIVAAMEQNLDSLSWMDATTKSKAKAKLAAMTYQIGYPKKWRSYAFKVDPGSFGANALAAMKAETARQFAKIGKPVDKDDWQMTTPQVNAYYDPQLNGMVFPAGILQPPFYSVNASIPVNLGAMGMVVGHELTHGFDDQGALYDAVGNMTNWWQPETEKQFKTRTQCVIDQYNAYEVVDGGRVNGANTVGENIADIGGVKLALRGYRALRASAPETVVADGFTEDQQFFLGFGQAWCTKMRPELEKLLANVDVHSPGKWRVNGSLQATPEFGKAFRCKANAKMTPAKQCVVW